MRHKTRSGRKMIRRLAGDIGPDRNRVLLSAFLITASRLCLAFLPLVSGSLIDRISGGAFTGQDIVT